MSDYKKDAAIATGMSITGLISGLTYLQLGVAKWQSITEAVYAANNYILTPQVIEQAERLANAQTWEAAILGYVGIVAGAFAAGFAVYDYNRQDEPKVAEDKR